MQYVDIRIERAYEHLESLRWSLEIFDNSKPYTVTRYNETEKHKHIVRVEMTDPINRVGILAGDFVHSLRTFLDHLIYALVVINTHSRPKSTKIEWPVLETPDEKLFNLKTDGVSREAAIIIEVFQPYHAGEGEAFKSSLLWQLHKLDVIDKHRRIPFGTHGLDVHFVRSMGVTPTDIVPHELDNGYEVEVPLVLANVPLTFDPLTVVFGEPPQGIRADLHSFENMYKLVSNEIFPAFASFFPDQVPSRKHRFRAMP
jgi:hypothetical protein